VGLTFRPAEDDAPPIFHPYAVKSPKSPTECLEPIARWRTEVAKHIGGVDHVEFPHCDRPDIARERPPVGRSAATAC
jgi:hypothetical protein